MAGNSSSHFSATPPFHLRLDSHFRTAAKYGFEHSQRWLPEQYNIVFSFTGGPDPVLDFFLRFDSLPAVPAVDGPPIVGRAILSACTPAQNCFYGSTQALLRASSIGPDKETGDAGQGAEIRGRVTSNDVDIFRISISDFSQFSATAIALGLTGSLQPQLFLFREFGPSEQWIAAGVYANARDQNFYGGSILPGISGYPRGFTTSR